MSASATAPLALVAASGTPVIDRPDPTCPCCGGSVATPDFLLDPCTGIVSFEGRSARLTHKEYALLRCLLDAYPAIVTRGALMCRLYDTSGDHPEEKILDVMACKIRKKMDLAGLGITITTDWGTGLRIEFAGELATEVLRERRLRETRKRAVFEASDLPVLAMLRAQGLSITAISSRLKITFRAVDAGLKALDAVERNREAHGFLPKAASA